MGSNTENGVFGRQPFKKNITGIKDIRLLIKQALNLLSNYLQGLKV